MLIIWATKLFSTGTAALVLIIPLILGDIFVKKCYSGRLYRKATASIVSSPMAALLIHMGPSVNTLTVGTRKKIL